MFKNKVLFDKTKNNLALYEISWYSIEAGCYTIVP